MGIHHITAELVRSLLDYDANTGVLRWRISRGRSKTGAIAGTVNKDGYIGISINATTLVAHRVIWLHVHGTWPEYQIDHINGNKSDNRISNLRDVPPAINSQNRTKSHKDSKSGILGVYWHSRDKRWIAQIDVGKRSHHIGTFRTEQEARDAYLAAKAQFHPGDIRNLMTNC